MSDNTPAASHAPSPAQAPSAGPLPSHGLSRDAVFEEMEQARADDADWRAGRLGLYVHFGGEDVLEVAKEAYQRFFSENALGPSAFSTREKKHGPPTNTNWYGPAPRSRSSSTTCSTTKTKPPTLPQKSRPCSNS